MKNGNIPITLLVGVYNEEDRIPFVLESGVKWADEIVVVDKSSTDRTKDICRQFGKMVRVVDVPFSPPGFGSNVENVQYASNDWVFVATASEIPTLKLIRRIRKVLNDSRGELDLIYIPRKYYSFGIHDPRSPWYVIDFPFLVNRRKAVVEDKIHKNFRPSHPENTAKIEYADDCCVYHLTHTNAKDFVQSMAGYFEVEAADCEQPEEKIKECFEQISKYEKQLRYGGDDIVGHYFVLLFYLMGTALFVWEKWRGVNVSRYYNQLRKSILKIEWNTEVKNNAFDVSKPSEVIPLSQKKKPLVSTIVWDHDGRYITKGFLEHIEYQTISEKMEVFVIADEEKEKRKINETSCREGFTSIKWIRKKPEQSVYSAINACLLEAKGKYVSLFYAADRLLPYANERMVHVLENKAEIALVYANAWMTETEEQTFESFNTTGSLIRKTFDPEALLKECYIGSQPMWRRSLHKTYGLFDPEFYSAGDWEFWLRIAQRETFYHMNEFLGLCFDSSKRIGRKVQMLHREETMRIYQKYKKKKGIKANGFKTA